MCMLGQTTLSSFTDDTQPGGEVDTSEGPQQAGEMG